MNFFAWLDDDCISFVFTHVPSTDHFCVALTCTRFYALLGTTASSPRFKTFVYASLSRLLFAKACGFACISPRAANEGNVAILRYLSNTFQLDPEVLYRVATRGHLVALKWLCPDACSSDSVIHTTYGSAFVRCTKDSWSSYAHYLAENGHLEGLRWLHETHGSEVRKHTMGTSIQHGHVDVVVWLQEHAYLMPENALTLAAKSGRVEMVRHLCDAYTWTPEVMAGAAESGSFDVIAFARSHGCPWDETACTGAASGGHLALLAHLHTQGCPWTSATAAAAADKGHLDVLAFLHAHGCPLDELVFEKAAGHGDLAVLEFLHQNGCPWNANACFLAALCDQFSALRFLHERNCPWDSSTCYGAACAANFDMLRYAYDRGCPMGGMTCAGAASSGALHILKWARKEGCPWTFDTTVMAAEAEEFKCLTYAVNRGCPINEAVAIATAETHNLRVLKWLILKHDCPWDERLYEYADAHPHTTVAKWINKTLR